MRTSRAWVGVTLLLGGYLFTVACGSEVDIVDDASRCGPEPTPDWCGRYTCVGDTWQPPCCGPPNCCGEPPTSKVPECYVWCNDGSWFATCECPAQVPAEGSACPDAGVQQYGCTYEESCGYYGF